MDPNSLLIITLAIAVGSLVKGATGVGLPMVAVPFIASLLGLHHAVAIMVIPVLLSNLWQLVGHREERHDPRMGFLPLCLFASGIGVVVGTFLLTALPERVLTFALGCILLSYLALRFLKPDFILGPAAASKSALPVGLAAGVLHGATGVSAPVTVPFIHAMRLGRAVHVYAICAIFFVLTVVQWPALYFAGIMRPEWIIEGLLALIPMAIFLPVGQWLASKLSASGFDKLILAFVGIMGTKMVLGL